MKKFAFIGAGSFVFTRNVVRDILTFPAFEDCELALMDIHPGRLEGIRRCVQRIVDMSGKPAKVTTTLSRAEALTGADFVVISILPGTFDEMESDVHAPEKYGIYQPVGDTTGPGGIVRALRTIPMIQEIARAVEEYCPDAWVINYTNPMAMCVKTLYETFPKIKAFGCCHEVFGTQSLLKAALDDMENDGTDFVVLHGNRERYRFWGFAMAGISHDASFKAYNIPNLIKKGEKFDFSFCEIGYDDKEYIKKSLDLFNLELQHYARTEDDFLDAQSLWHGKTYAVLDCNGKYCGYLNYSEHFAPVIREIELNSPKDAARVIYSFLNFKGLQSISVNFSVFNWSYLTAL